MIPLFSTAQIRSVDEYAIKNLKMPGIILMENASLEIYNSILENFDQKKSAKKVGIICGKGNNGGDGYAAARHFSNNNFDVTVISIGSVSELSKDSAINFNILKQISLSNKNLKLIKYKSANDLNKLKDCDIIIDAILGSGITGDLKEPYDLIVKKINEFSAYKVAIDIPTGLNADSGDAKDLFIADLTITLAEFKKGLFISKGYECCGKIVKGNIGISSSHFDQYEVDDYLIEPEDVLKALPKKDKSIHKYSSGKVFTIAGSGKLPGASLLTANAVFKAGAGASILAFPHSLKNNIIGNLGEIILYPYDDAEVEFLSDDNIDEMNERIEWADVIAIGPGLGREQSTVRAVQKILNRYKDKKIVIDADGLFPLNSNEYKNFDLRNKILTPHHGEFGKLLGIKSSELEEDILKHGKKFAQETESFLVLKGAPTIIFTPTGDALINTTGNPGMAKFGTGDVLTGIIAGFVSQSKTIESGIIAAVYVHSLAADILLKEKTEFSYSASDIIDRIPDAINLLRRTID
jgi:ADP-dependent NAD(P)H-hydrate dehydratase / NAD(P)H-hydrate epimerase